MKKKGFTLIELLAVIVILAIIALIATPIVMNVIESSRKGAAERSAENYLRAVDIAIAEERINGPIEDGEYKIMEDGSLCKGTVSETTCTGTKLSVEVDGTKPEAGGTILIQNGRVVNELTVQNAEGEDEVKTTLISVGEYDASVDETGKVVVTKKEEEKEEGESGGSDFTPTSLISISEVCYPTSRETTGNIPEGNYEYGDEYECNLGDGVDRRFFVIENGATTQLTKGTTGTTAIDEVSLIMKENLVERSEYISISKYEELSGEDTSSSEACTEGGFCTKNTYGPVTALEKLAPSNTSWREEGIEVNLPTREQILAANNNSSSTDITSWLAGINEPSGGHFDAGYWTSSLGSSCSGIGNDCAYAVSFNAITYSEQLFADEMIKFDHYGVRPVITLARD